MSRITSESPMDFEYTNPAGTIVGASPFAQVSQNMRRNHIPSSPTKSAAKKRTFGDGYNTTSRVDQLRTTPWGSPSKASTDKQLPPTPFNGPPAFSALFTTPHKSQEALDDSSAGETPRSPENNDSDATPDTNIRSAITRFDHATQPTRPGAERNSSPSKEMEGRPSAPRQNSLQRAWGSLKKKMNSPSHNTAKSENRVEKRRKGQVDRKFVRQRRHSMSDSGDESERPPRRTSPRKTSRQKHDHDLSTEPKQPHWIASFFTFIGQHPTVPTILSFYAQLIFNVALLCFCFYLVLCFWGAVQGDVDKRSWEAQAVVRAEMAACAEQFNANRCDRDTRVPALENVCENWALCMSQDPSKVKRAQVGAQTFAEIFNAFVEAISYKAMAFSFIMVFGCFAISNFAFGYFRHKANEHPQFHQPPPQYYPPPTPQRSFSGQGGGQESYGGGTPWYLQHQQGFDPLPSAGGGAGRYGQIEGQGSPVRRLEFQREQDW